MNATDAVSTCDELRRKFGDGCWTAYRSARDPATLETVTVCTCGDGRGAIGIGPTWEQAVSALFFSRIRAMFAQRPAAPTRHVHHGGYGKASW